MANHFAQLIVATEITKDMLFVKNDKKIVQCTKCDKIPKNKSARFCEDCGGKIDKCTVKNFIPAFEDFAKTFNGLHRSAQDLYDFWHHSASLDGHIGFVDVSANQNYDCADFDSIGIMVKTTNWNENISQIYDNEIQEAKERLQSIINALNIKSSIEIFLCHIED